MGSSYINLKNFNFSYSLELELAESKEI